MKYAKNIIYVLAYYLFSYSHSLAHVKWFVDSDEIIENAHEGTIYDLDGGIVWLCLGFLVLLILLARYLDVIVKTPQKLLTFVGKYEKHINRIAQILLGVFMLVTVNFFWHTIITPEVSAGNTARFLLEKIQILIGLMFIFNIFPRIASISLIGLCIGLGLWSGPITFLENLLLLSVAIYFLIKNSPKGSKLYDLNDHAVDILRIGSGICLVVLAFTEKLAYPELSSAFLHAHNWNFMHPFFSGFSDNFFILSVGASEVLFGLVLIFGYLTRITVILLAIFLISSATAMFVSVGDWEPGHIAVYVVALILLAFGSGRIKFFQRNNPR